MKEFRNTGKIKFSPEMWDKWHMRRAADAEAGRQHGLAQGIQSMRLLLNARDLPLDHQRIEKKAAEMELRILLEKARACLLNGDNSQRLEMATSISAYLKLNTTETQT